MKRWDVLAVGGVNIDYMLTVPRLPAHDEKVGAHFLGRFPGGPAANFACAASRLGLGVVSVATLGSDVDADRVIADFERFGVDTSLITRKADYQTPFTIIMLDETGERAILVPDFEEQYPIEPLIAALPQARSLYMMPVMFANFLLLAKQARELGLEVMVDIEANHMLSHAQFEQLLRFVTVASFNHDGFRCFTGLEATLASARTLLSTSLHTVVITRGKEGSLAVTHDQEAQCPAFRVPVIDTTGAGDAFNAGFITGMFMGMQLHQRLQFANAVAALKVQRQGTRGCLPSFDEVQAWINTD